ncbi:MAG: choice-of-anchor D domain-containing protein [Terriglobales bacterium]
MRSLPPLVIALLFCALMTVRVEAQQLQCDPCRHPFGKVPVGDSFTYSFQLSNTGSETLTITSTSVQGKYFSFGEFPLPANVEPGSSVELPVIFTPTELRWTSAILIIISNSPGSPLEMKISGTGVADGAQLGISPAALNFGNVTVGSSSSLQATLTASDAAVTIWSDQSTNSEFAIIGLNLPATLEVGQSLPVTIQFTPNATGTASGQAAFISNAANSPTTEALTGTGVAPGSPNVYLSWNPGDGEAVGYNVYRGTAQGGPYQMINTGLDASTNYTDYTVVSGTTYFYVATEVNAQGQQSAYSNVAEAVIPE